MTSTTTITLTKDEIKEALLNYVQDDSDARISPDQVSMSFERDSGGVLLGANLIIVDGYMKNLA